jgi:hypothetical protein|nr:MAG TPA: hypothetical protein [Caudoviricetes sp.]
MLIGFIKITENYIIDGLDTGVMVQRHLILMTAMQTSYIFNKNDASNKLGVQIYNTRYTVGGISKRSQFSATDTIQSIIIKMLGDSGQLPVDTSTPNTRYKSQDLGTWSNVSDIDYFLYRCCHDTGYYGATIGSYVTIKDDVYNKEWIIAGFDMEHNQTASDGNTNDNGYGICLIPRRSLGSVVWDSSSTEKGYNGSAINKTILSEVADNLKRVLGEHLVLRNVLLSTSRDSNYCANSYIWTNAYCTLMSTGQVTGTFASTSNKFDDGEANYKLPLFNYETWSFDNWAWLRGICSKSYGNNYVYGISNSGKPDWNLCYSRLGLRPLIYIR